MNKQEVCAIIPVYNEEKTIKKIINNLIKVSSVIIIDDCSNDKSYKYSKKTRAIVLRNSVNCGYSHCLTLGFKKANQLKFKFVISFDGDGQHSIKDFKKIMKFLKEEYVIVSGNRNNFPRLSEKIFSLYSILFHRIKDPLSGLKGYNLNKCKKFGLLDFENNIGTKTLINISRQKKLFKEFNIKIKDRAKNQKPRFGNFINSNLKIFYALFKTAIEDLSIFLSKK